MHPTTAYSAPNRSIDLHPKSAYMHPGVSAYMYLIPHTHKKNVFAHNLIKCHYILPIVLAIGLPIVLPIAPGGCTRVCLQKRFLCMHKILVYAQHSCACTALLCMHWRGDPNKNRRGSGPGRLLFFASRPWALALQCMHKSVVHAQESCACTRVLTNKPLC